MESEDLRIRMYGETAVVAGRGGLTHLSKLAQNGEG